MKRKILKFLFNRFQNEFYDFIVEQFIGQVPDAVSEPAMDWLADKKVLFEKFLSIQAYHIQRARIQNNKSQEFYDGALVIIKAFLVAVNKKVVQRTTVIPTIDPTVEVKDSLGKVDEFLKGFAER